MGENPDHSGEERDEAIRKYIIAANIWLATGLGLYLYDDFTSDSTGKNAVANVTPAPQHSPALPSAVPPAIPRSQPTVLAPPSVPKEPVELTMDQIGEKIMKALLILEFSNGYSKGLCTGFVYGPRTFMTAKHCPGVYVDRKGENVVTTPYITSIHEYPSDSNKLFSYNRNPQRGHYQFFGGDPWTLAPDVVKSDFDTDIFSDREPLEKAPSVPPSPTEKYYTVHFVNYPNKWVPLDKWKWYVEQGAYVDDIFLRTEENELSQEHFMLMKNIRQGNSGSPVVNSYGQVIGVISRIKQGTDQVYVAPFPF